MDNQSLTDENASLRELVAAYEYANNILQQLVNCKDAHITELTKYNDNLNTQLQECQTDMKESGYYMYKIQEFYNHVIGEGDDWIVLPGDPKERVSYFMKDEERRGYEKLIRNGMIVVKNDRILVRRGWFFGDIFNEDDRDMIEALAGLKK